MINDATQDAPTAPPDSSAISLVELANAVLRNWRLVLVLPMLLALLVGTWSLSRDRAYAASTSFMPQVSEGRAAGGAAALAQQFGVSLGTERPGQSPQFYIELLRSRELLRQAVESEYRIRTEEGNVSSGTLVEYWDLDEQDGIVPPWREATEVLREAVSASVSRETGVVELTVTSADPLLAQQIAERLLELLNAFNLKISQTRAEEEGRFIATRMREAQENLLSAERALEAFLRQNRQFENSPELTFEHDRLQRQVIMRQEVYTSLLRSQQQAQIDAVRDIPLFTVIDEPTTAEPQGRGTIALALAAFLLGLVLAVLIALIREAARRGGRMQNPHFREFQVLARTAWSDLRHPARWVGR